MADFALTADQVGQVVSYVAPGFLAQLGYRARYPAPDRPAGDVLIIAVVTSLPLVAAAHAITSGSHRPTQLGYATALLVGSFIIGYAIAAIRGWERVKKVLALADYRIEPEGSIYAQTVKHMTPSGAITIELKDGRRISGTPRNGPETKDDGINELYLTHPEALDDGQWTPVGPAIIVPLAEVSNIVLSEDPTHAG